MTITGICTIAIAKLQMAQKQDGVKFVLCSKQGDKIEGVVLNRVCILELFCSKQG